MELFISKSTGDINSLKNWKDNCDPESWADYEKNLEKVEVDTIDDPYLSDDNLPWCHLHDGEQYKTRYIQNAALGSEDLIIVYEFINTKGEEDSRLDWESGLVEVIRTA